VRQYQAEWQNYLLCQPFKAVWRYTYMRSLIVLVLISFAFAAGAAEPRSTSTTSVVKKAIPRKPKLLRSNPHHKVLLVMTDEDPNEIDDGELAPFYRRPKLIPDHDSDQLSDFAQTRLLIARARALAKYRETWS